MKKIILASLLATAAAAGVAHAENEMSCGNVPKDKWMTQEQMKAKAQEQGFEVRQVKAEGDCYEVYGIRNGAKIEALFNPQTGEQVGED